MARILTALTLLVAIALLSAAPAGAGRTGSEPPLSVQSRTLAAERFAAGARDEAVVLMRLAVNSERHTMPRSAALAFDLMTLASYLDAPDDDSVWEDAEDLRLEAIAILAALPKEARLHQDAIADLAIHYIRREYGRDFAEQAAIFFDAIADAPDADARGGRLVAAACQRADFGNFPALALDFAGVANLYLARFSGGDDATVICAAKALSLLLDEGREYDGLLDRSAELTRLVAAGTLGPAAAMAAFDLRARIFLALGRPDETIPIADLALQRTASPGTPAPLHARALAIRAEARLQKGDAAGAAADATDAVLGYETAGDDRRPEQALTLALLAEILGTVPDRQSAVDGLLARATKLARDAATAKNEGWEKALARSYTLAISRQLAAGDPAAASQTADDLAALKSGTLDLPWVQDWQSIVAFPANVALLLYRRDFEGAEYYLSLERVALDADYFRQHNYLVPPLRQADIAEYGVILALMQSSGADATPLDASAILATLDEALRFRSENLPETHPLLVQHFALRAVALDRLGRQDAAIAAAREGVRRFIARGVPARRSGGSIAGLFVDPVYQQLVVSAWLGLETLPR